MKRVLICVYAPQRNSKTYSGVSLEGRPHRSATECPQGVPTKESFLRQLTYIKKNTLHWCDVPPPTLQAPTDALVRPTAAARCDGDKVFLFNNITTPILCGLAVDYLDPVATEILGPRPYRGPFAVGHECVGEVVECGEAVKFFRRGDSVIVPWAISCGLCTHCSLGLTSKCLEAGNTLLSSYGFGSGMGRWGGMVSDLVRAPHADQLLVRMPTGVAPVTLASASDNIPDAWRTVAPHLQARSEAPVLVVGGGAESIGLYAAAIAVAMGAGEVDYVDFDRERLDIAVRVGANPVSMGKSARSKWYRKQAPLTRGRYPITVDASAHADGLRYAIRSLAPGGVCTSVGYYFQKTTGVPLLQMYANDATLKTGVSHARANLPQVLDLLAAGHFRPELITSLVAQWDDADEAFLERTTKVIVHRAPMFA